jgi:hypothetical protein
MKGDTGARGPLSETCTVSFNFYKNQSDGIEYTTNNSDARRFDGAQGAGSPEYWTPGNIVPFYFDFAGCPGATGARAVCLVRAEKTVTQEDIDGATGIGCGVEIIKIPATTAMNPCLRRISKDHTQTDVNVPDGLTGPGEGVTELGNARSAFNTDGYLQLFVCDDFPCIANELQVIEFDLGQHFDISETSRY